MIPRSLVIAGERWSVVRKDMSDSYGLCDYTNRVIYLDRDLEPEESEEILLHEIMHACTPSAFGIRVEERIIRQITPRLLTILKTQWRPRVEGKL